MIIDVEIVSSRIIRYDTITKEIINEYEDGYTTYSILNEKTNCTYEVGEDEILEQSSDKKVLDIFWDRVGEL